MPRMTISETINATPQRTFEVATDFEHAADNIKAIKRLEVLTDGPIGKGTRFKETRLMWGREATETMEITQWEPGASPPAPPSFAVGVDSCGARFESVFRFHPERGGKATRLEMEINTRAVSLFAKIMSPLSKLMMGAMKKCIAGDIADIRRIAEGGETAA